MLVHKLRHRVLNPDDVIVEKHDFSLQSDTVDKVHGNCCFQLSQALEKLRL